MNREQRNAEICKQYLGNGKTPGATLEQLGNRYGLSRERVRQIVRDAGVLKADRVARPRRSSYLGLHVIDPIVDAMKQEAVKRSTDHKKVSVSALATEWLIKELTKLGYEDLGNV